MVLIAAGDLSSLLAAAGGLRCSYRRRRFSCFLVASGDLSSFPAVTGGLRCSHRRRRFSCFLIAAGDLSWFPAAAGGLCYSYRRRRFELVPPPQAVGPTSQICRPALGADVATASFSGPVEAVASAGSVESGC